LQQAEFEERLETLKKIDELKKAINSRKKQKAETQSELDKVSLNSFPFYLTMNVP
jgi:hypothetical protein